MDKEIKEYFEKEKKRTQQKRIFLSNINWFYLIPISVNVWAMITFGKILDYAEGDRKIIALIAFIFFVWLSIFFALKLYDGVGEVSDKIDLLEEKIDKLIKNRKP